MKVQTSKLSGVALDWAVAKCEGIEVRIVDGLLVCPLNLHFAPSYEWAYAGMIIEREKVSLRWDITRDEPEYGVWFAQIDLPRDEMVGSTPLIAAMRCYVESKLGYVVEVPDEVA